LRRREETNALHRRERIEEMAFLFLKPNIEEMLNLDVERSLIFKKNVERSCISSLLSVAPLTGLPQLLGWDSGRDANW
jgi:hypothetical protein